MVRGDLERLVVFYWVAKYLYLSFISYKHSLHVKLVGLPVAFRAPLREIDELVSNLCLCLKKRRNRTTHDHFNVVSSIAVTRYNGILMQVFASSESVSWLSIVIFGLEYLYVLVFMTKFQCGFEVPFRYLLTDNTWAMQLILSHSLQIAIGAAQ